MKRSGTLKRTQRRESALERRAREHFNETVKDWPCWFRSRPGERIKGECEDCGGEGAMAGEQCSSCRGYGRHHCEGRKDAHHLIPKQYIRRMFQAVLPEPEFVAILFNPLIGAPLCRKAHDSIERGFDRIYWQDLSDECIEYVSSLPDFMLIELERKCPKRPPSIREVA